LAHIDFDESDGLPVLLFMVARAATHWSLRLDSVRAAAGAMRRHVQAESKVMMIREYAFTLRNRGVCDAT